MTRADLLRAADLARAAADAATIAASFDNIKPDQAERYARQSEEALHEALDALAMAQLGPARATTLHPIFAEIFDAIRPEARGQALSRPVEEAA